MSCGVVFAYGKPLGVTRNPSNAPSRQRALTLPDLPRLMPASFMASAVAIIAPRSSSSVMDFTPRGGGPSRSRPVREHGRQPVARRAGDAALRDEAGDEAGRRDVEREVLRPRVVGRDR